MSVEPTVAALAAHVRYAGACANLDRLQALASAAAPGAVREVVDQAARDLPNLERVHALTAAAYAIANRGWSDGIPAGDTALTRLTGMAEIAVRTTRPEPHAALLRVFSWQPHALTAEAAAAALTSAVLVLTAHAAAGSDYLDCWIAHA
jgi:hypothetical protein